MTWLLIADRLHLLQPRETPSPRKEDGKGKSMEASWESELASLLTDLLATQDQLLGILTRKRELLSAADTEGLAEISAQEEELIGCLQHSLQRREQLLERARLEGHPAGSVQSLTQALPRDSRGKMGERVRLAKSRARLLKHHSLTNWVLVQRTLIHLSQVLEIIATGGRLQPTYGEAEPVNASGALVDRAV